MLIPQDPELGVDQSAVYEVGDCHQLVADGNMRQMTDIPRPEIRRSTETGPTLFRSMQ